VTKSNQTLLDLYRLMRVTRTLDRVIGAHDGHWHGLEGEEATIAGVYHGLRRSDVVAAHYRGMVSAAYAKGADLRVLLAGCLGKATSYHRGRHRSDICGPPEFNVIGLYSGSLGPPLGYATGAALAAKIDGRDDVAVGVFGDGSSSRGDCHEAMNMASVMKLPVIFVCQNNQIAISTAASAGVGGEVARRGEGFGMPGQRIDGNDVLAVHDAMQTAIARARAGEGPSLIECLTYRVAGHFYSDAEEYRDADEVAAWRRRDPIAAFRALLDLQGVLDEAGLEAIDREVEAEVGTAWQLAMDDPLPDSTDLGVDEVFA
jgi:acetoin:2,6-dichlorophenolindophenol oxidoreductase subunit alpha